MALPDAMLAAKEIGRYLHALTGGIIVARAAYVRDVAAELLAVEQTGVLSLIREVIGGPVEVGRRRKVGHRSPPPHGGRTHQLLYRIRRDELAPVEPLDLNAAHAPPPRLVREYFEVNAACELERHIVNLVSRPPKNVGDELLEFLRRQLILAVHGRAIVQIHKSRGFRQPRHIRLLPAFPLSITRNPAHGGK